MGVVFSVGIPALVALVSVPAGRSALPSLVGGYVRTGVSLAGPVSLEGTFAVNLSPTTSLVILTGGDVGLGWDLVGGPRVEHENVLGRAIESSTHRLRARTFLGYRNYNFSELDANQGADIIRSETFSKGSYLAPGLGVLYSRAIVDNVSFESELSAARALFFSKSPLTVTEVTLRLGVGVDL
jgi:hypothetical protein